MESRGIPRAVSGSSGELATLRSTIGAPIFGSQEEPRRFRWIGVSNEAAGAVSPSIGGRPYPIPGVARLAWLTRMVREPESPKTPPEPINEDRQFARRGPHVFRFDPNDIDPVVRSVDRRIRKEAIRQLDSIDLDDDDDRIDPLPSLTSAEADDVVRARPGRGGSH